MMGTEGQHTADGSTDIDRRPNNEGSIRQDSIADNLGIFVQRAMSASEEAARNELAETQLLARGIELFARRVREQAIESVRPEFQGPYKGLLYYRFTDAGLFFGRRRATDQLLQNIERSPLTVLHGDAGVGKTSLLLAGIAPRLIANGHLPVYVRAMHSDPTLALKRTLISDLSNAPSLMAASLRDFVRQISGVLGGQARLYVFFDQFEEFFTQLDGSSRAKFVVELGECLDDESLSVRWILAVRREFFSDLYEFESVYPRVFYNQYGLKSMTQTEAREAVINPAALYGISYEEGLVDALLEDLGPERILPPQLQLTCVALYEALVSGETIVTQEQYQALGGAAGILGDYMNRTLARNLPVEQRPTARQLLGALVTADGQPALRTREDLVAELADRGVGETELDRILGPLVDSHLLRTEAADGYLGMQAYRLASDYLVPEIRYSPETQARKAAQELLNQGIQAYQRHSILLSAGQLAVLEAQGEDLVVDAVALDLLLRSAQELEVPLQFAPKLANPHDPQVVERLLRSLEQYAPPSGLRRLLPDRRRREKADMRQFIARLLGETDDQRAVEPLIAQMQDPETGPRLAAVQALVQIGDDRAVDALRAAMVDSDLQVRDAATVALQQIAAAGKSDSAELPEEAPSRQVPEADHRPREQQRDRQSSEEALGGQAQRIPFDEVPVEVATSDQGPEMTILIVADESMITDPLVRLARRMLKGNALDRQYNVVSSNNPVEALARLKESTWDLALVISGIMMSEMNGLDFLAEVKQLYPLAPRIVLTGWADKENAIRAINELDLYYYVEKPWDDDQFRRLMLNALEKHRLDSAKASILGSTSMITQEPGGVILIVDDEPIITGPLGRLIQGTLSEDQRWQYTVIVSNNPLDALADLEKGMWDLALVISDIMMPEMNGLDFLAEVKRLYPLAPRIVLTGYADKDNAIRALNELDLYYYVEKPWDDDWLAVLIGNALKQHQQACGEEVLMRLHTESQEALVWAEDLRQATGATDVCNEHLLAGLYQDADGPVHRLLTLFDNESIVSASLESLVNGMAAPNVRFEDIHPTLTDTPRTVSLSVNTQKVLAEAARLADGKGSAHIRSQHLLASLLAVPGDTAGQWIADTLQVDCQALYQLIVEAPDDALPLDEIRRASGRLSFYRLLLNVTPGEPTVGQRVHLRVDLLPAEPGGDAFELPIGVSTLYCFVSADGLHIRHPEVAVLLLDLGADQPLTARFELQAYLRGSRAYAIELFAEDPNLGGVPIGRASGEVVVNPPVPGQERAPILPALDLQVAPQPDCMLLIESDLPKGDGGPHHLIYRLTSRLPGLRFDNEVVGQVTLDPADLCHIQSLVHGGVQSAIGVQPEDAQERMLSLGRYLYDQLFPLETAAIFREAFWGADALWQDREQSQQIPPTWFIVEDGVTWLPWELVVPYRPDDSVSLSFLGERYRLSRWIAGLGRPLYSEIPMGEVVLAHYKVLDLGDAERDEELLAWRWLLNVDSAGGILQVIKPETPYYGVHVLRHVDPEREQLDIVARGGAARVASPEDEVPRARLDLRLKRPMVTLSVLGRNGFGLGTSDDGWLLPERLMPFLRAGASAVIGPWWPTSEAADRIFWATFYDLLMRRMTLGEAVWRARLAVRRAVSHRPDWLAFTLFGDPRARPYWLEKSIGYAALECLSADKTMYSGRTYVFRASISSRPPVSYQDRLIQAEEPPNQLRALFLSPGLQTTLPRPVEMKPVGRTMCQATVDLTPPAPGDYPLVVQLFDGDEHLKTLQMNLAVHALSERGHVQ